jgi:thiol:disulfide interchange protein DsbD
VRGARIGWAAVAVLVAGVLPAAGQSGLRRAKDIVAPSAYVSLDPVPRGRAFELAVVMKIRPGFHVNAREVSEDYLIPTELTAGPLAGFRFGTTNYPKGVLRTFPFSKTPLNLYEGSVTLRIRMEALASAPLGLQKIALKLRYQACSDSICLPPVTLPIEVNLEVAPAGASVQPVHPEIFANQAGG